MAWTIVAAAMAAGTFAAAAALVSLGRRRPPALALALAFSLVVAFESTLAPALSVARAYARGPLLAAHLAVLLLVAAVAVRSPRPRDAALRALRAFRGRRMATAAAVAPVLVLAAFLAFVAAAYAPNNWDSMTYHLARIAHWIQRGSVAPYPTGIDRQVALAPGAEYVLGAWQAVARSDRLASFLQLAAWAVSAFAAAPLLRLAGAPRTIAWLGVAVAASVPMAVLQATSTQNDLVAAAACLAVIAAVVPYLGRARTRPSDAVLLGVTLAAGALVKVTALVVAAPFVAWALAARARRAARSRREAAALLGAVATCALAAAIVSLPDAATRLADRGVREANAVYAAAYLYPPAEASGDRLLNLARGIGRHFALPLAARVALGRQVPSGCTAGAWTCPGEEVRAFEDCRGNPRHVLVFAALVAAAVLGRRSLPRRGRVLLGLAVAGWVAFQLTFRDNPWITRLEGPAFALSPLALVALSGLPRRAAVAIAALAAAVLLDGGFEMAAQNELRPRSGARAARHHPEAYYGHDPDLRPVHDAVLDEARRRGCRRLGLHLGPDAWDYPLTWRAMRAGIETRHVFGADPWPCLVFADGMPPARPEWGWSPAGPKGLFENRQRAAYSTPLRPTP